MVFESVLVDLLNKHLGQYVENLDSSQLKIGIWGGNVVLQNLYLRPSTLDELDLPVKTLFGCLGKLTLQIPWNNLYSAPVVASIEGLYILAVPNKAMKYDALKDEKQKQYEKQAELKKVEEAKKKEKELENAKQPVNSSFIEKISAQIVKNVEVTIKNIHIRFEDRISCPGRTFALGVTLDSLTVKTIDHWGQDIAVDPVNLIFKELAISCLCLYWNPDIHDLYSNIPQDASLLKLFSEGIAKPEKKPSNYNYMLGPINAVSKLRINTKPELDNSNFSVPKLYLVSDLPDLRVKISRAQYRDLICVIEAIDFMQRAAIYRKYRPDLTEYKGHAKEWWKFAYNCILEEQIRRRKKNWSWSNMKSHREACRNYISAYKDKISVPKPDPKVVDQCKKLEEILDAFNIILLRERVEMEVSKADKRESLQSAGGGWFSSWWGGKSSNHSLKNGDEDNLLVKFENAMTPEEKKKLFRAIDYTEGDLPTEYPKYFVKTNVEVLLHKLQLELLNSEYDIPVVSTLVLNMVNLVVKQRDNGIMVSTAVKSFDITGCTQGNYIPKLVTTIGNGNAMQNLLEVMFETNPLDNEDCDKRVKVSAQPLHIVYDSLTIDRVSGVFDTEKPIEAAAIQSAVQLKLDQIKEMSASGVQHLIQKHEVLDLDIYMKSSIIVIPKGGILDKPDKTRLVLSLGTIKMQSIVLDRSENVFKSLRGKFTEEAAHRTLDMHSYDHFKLNITDVQVVLGLEGESLKGELSPEVYMLRPTTLNIEVQKCIIPDNPRLPRLKVSATLEGILLHIEILRLQKLMDVILTLPSGTKPQPVEEDLYYALKKYGSSLSMISVGRSKSSKLEKIDKDKQQEVIQFTELELEFELKEMILEVIDHGKTFLNFNLNSINVDVVQQTFNQSILIKLVEIDMIQMYGNRQIKVIQTQPIADDKNYLFSVELIIVDKRSPEFHSVYGSVLQTVKVDFTALNFYMHCEALLELMSKVKTLLPQSNETPKPKVKPVPSVLEPIMESKAPSRRFTRFASAATSKSKIFSIPEPKKSTGTDAIDMKIEFQMGEIAMTLANKKEAIMDMKVSGGEAGIILRAAYTMINAQLNGIELINLATTSMYAKVVSLVDETAALKANIVVFNEHPSNTNNVDLKLKAHISRMRFIFIKTFVDRVLNFMNHFQDAQQALLEASQAAAEAAKQNVQEAYQKATKVELSFDLKAPIIYVPTNETSNDVFILDFGSLKAENTLLEIPSTTNNPETGVLDRIRVTLKDLKLFRAFLDNSLNYLKESPMISPVTFKLTVQRNLSSAYFTDIPDLEILCVIPSICINIAHSDYVQFMKMLDENINSNAVMIEPSIPVLTSSSSELIAAGPPRNTIISNTESVWQPTDSLQAFKDGSDPITDVIEPVPDNAKMSIKFMCNLDEVVVKIMDSSDLTGKTDLAKITLHFISVKGSTLSDGSLQVSLLLLDLIVDDTRPSQANKISRYMERKKEGETTAIRTKILGVVDSATDEKVSKSMVDIVYQQKKDNVFANVKVSTFILILNVDHLTKVAAVFTLPVQPVLTAAPSKTKALSPSVSDYSKANKAPEDKPVTNLMTFNFNCEHPDIILVEHMDDIDTNALVMHCEIQFKTRISGNHQTISGSINDMQLFSCCYNPEKRKSTKIPVLEPFSLILAGTTPEDAGLHLDLSSTSIKLSVTPGTIQLLSNISYAVTGSIDEEVTDSANMIDRTDMWNIQKFEDTDYYFLKTEMGTEAEPNMMFASTPEPKNELCVISIPSIVIILETGVGATTMPVLHVEKAIKAYIRNWSSLLNIESNIQIQVSYFNHTLALWEPILEPVEEADGSAQFTPWSLSIQVETNKVSSDISSPDATDLTLLDGGKKNPAMYVHVTSKEVMPLTLTKTCLAVLQQLSNNFSDAIYKPTVSSGMRPQYVILNDSGLPITVKLDNSDFTLWQESSDDVKEVLLDPGAHLNLSSTVTQILSSTSIASKENQGNSIQIYVEKFDCELRVPISRADKRYFSLNYRSASNDSWGMVSEVAISNGCTTATLRGIIQVKNYFNVPVSVYYMTKKGNEVSYVNIIEPRGTLNLPLDSIYTPTSELFFSFEGYSVSVVPFIWKELQQSLQKSIIMKCNPKNIEDKDPFFFKASGELEQIYYENTTLHTMASSCYNISLRPTVIFKNLLPIDIVVVVQGDNKAMEAPPKTILPGEFIQIPTAEPGHSSLIVTIPNYLDRDWCCKHEIEESAEELTIWTFESYESVHQITLELGIHTADIKGSILMELYCPFWMINKTGLMLSYKRSSKAEKDSSPAEQEQGTNVLYHPDDFTGPILFSFKAKNFFAKKKSQLRVGDGTWSEKFSLDVAGSAGVVSCATKTKTYEIGITIQLTYSTLTKQVMFTPYFVVVNHWNIELEFQEDKDKDNKWISVKEKDCAPFWPVNQSSSMIKVRVAGTEQATALFPYKVVHHSLLKLENKYGATTIDVQVSDGGTYIALFPYEDGRAPALVINHTSREIEFRDKSKDKPIHLKKNEQVLFTWDKFDEKQALLVNKKTHISIQGDGIGSLQVGNKEFYWTSFLFGLQRVLLFTEEHQIASGAQSLGDVNVPLMEIEVAISGIGISLVDNIARAEILHMGITSSGLQWLSRKPNKKRYKPLSDRESALIEDAYQRYKQTTETGKKIDPRITVDHRITVDFVLMEMIKPAHKQLKRAYKNGFWIHLIQSQHLLQFHAKINRIQIDNQMFDCVFPVVLAPVPPPKSIASAVNEKPFVEVSIVKRVNEHNVVQQYKYFKVLVQEFDVRVDIGFVNAMMSMFESGEDYSRDKEIAGFLLDLQFKDQPLHFHVVQTSIRDQKHFYDYLHLSPLKIHLSFTLSSGGNAPGGGTDNKTKAVPPFINLLMQSLGVTLTDIQGVIFKLSYFERDFCFLTSNQLQQEVQMHYYSQLVKQLYVLVLGLDVIGNPFGLVVGLGQGAADLFYEPFQGAIQGPGEFATGLVYGFRSLIGHTVGGAAGAVSKITGAMGKGIAALTFDKDYQRHRREMVGHKPANFQEGLAQSGKGLVMGVVDGVTGVIRQPISGAKDEGLGGFCKGVGKGLVGLVTRPMAGLTDFASGSLSAVKRATDMSEDVLRMRSPRCIQADGLVKPFSRREAEGLKLLMSVDKGKYAKTDMYIYHILIGQKKDVLLLTDKRIAYISINEIFGGHQVEWSYRWVEFNTPSELTDKGVKISFAKKKGMKNLFQSTDAGRILLIEQEETKKTINDMINDLILKNTKFTPNSQT